MISRAHMRRLSILLLFLGQMAWAGPFIPAGDMALRQDIQRLADAGVITGPTTTWPLAWGPILEDLRDADAMALPSSVQSALMRVRDRARWETRTKELTLKADAAIAENPMRIRGFADTPRGKAELEGGVAWIDDWFDVDLNVQAVDSEQDDEDLRVDDSLVGVVVGNWSVAASTQQRWWGPGWDGSLILSNNARPIPSLTIDRVFTDAFQTKWLSWLGPWDLSVMFGQMESARVVPDTQFFGMRFNFRPVPSLEIGVSRTAQWCGDGRPCDIDTFVDLLLGKDNQGEGSIDPSNEPGNQLAGVDFRWSPGFAGMPVAAYGQFIGEDEAGGLPSRYIGQLGVESFGLWRDEWSLHWFAEVALTNCQFYQAEEHFNCAYNHGIYETGYRYRGRAVGHGADNDARIFSSAVSLVGDDYKYWKLLLRVGELNRLGGVDIRNSLTPTPQDIISLDLTHRRGFRFGVIEMSVGFEQIDDSVTSASDSDARAYLRWRNGY